MVKEEKIKMLSEGWIKTGREDKENSCEEDGVQVKGLKNR